MRRRSSAPPSRRTTVTPRPERDVLDPEAHRVQRLIRTLRALFPGSVIDIDATNPTTKEVTS